MDHPEYTDMFSSYFEGQLSEEATRDFEGHISSCEACRESYEKFKKTIELLHGLTQKSPPQDFYEKLQKRVKKKKPSSLGGLELLKLSYPIISIMIILVLFIFYVQYLAESISNDTRRPVREVRFVMSSRPVADIAIITTTSMEQLKQSLFKIAEQCKGRVLEVLPESILISVPQSYGPQFTDSLRAAIKIQSQQGMETAKTLKRPLVIKITTPPSNISP